jgi:hypothetical protein
VAALPELGTLMTAACTCSVLSPADARRGAGPARAQSVGSRPALSRPRVVDPVATRRAALLSFALAELWQRRDVAR